MKNLFLSSIRAVLLSSSLAFLALSSAACTSDGEAVCEAKCDCEGCSNNALNDCYAEADSNARAADRNGCLDLWDELQACKLDTGFCKSNGDLETSCGSQKDRWENCIK